MESSSEKNIEQWDQSNRESNPDLKKRVFKSGTLL